MDIDAVIADLRAKLSEKGVGSAVFDDVLNDYAHMMRELEDLRGMAARLKGDPEQGSLYIRCLSRMSQIEKDKRSTLHYLGVLPEKAVAEKEEAYDL